MAKFHRWAPGVLNKQQLQKLHEEGCIQSTSQLDKNYDYSSIDLTLSANAYYLPEGSIKPFGEEYEILIAKEKKLFKKLVAKKGEFILEPKKTYLFELEQTLGKQLKQMGVFGQATAKSSIGRVDVLARLIVDGMDCYEAFTPEGMDRGRGTMWVEITPITFTVKVKKGVPITQLRLFLGEPSTSEISGPYAQRAIFPENDGYDGTLCVDLSHARITPKRQGCAFRAKDGAKFATAETPIALWNLGDARPNPADYWTVESSASLAQGRHYFPVKKNEFFILRSKQRISLPAGICIYCKAIDETIGEMRIHYAGFVHPFFGTSRIDKQEGTPLIFEVRGHDVEVLLTDNEKLAKLTLYRMSQDAKEEEENNYTNQILDLSKFFGPWKD